MLQLKPIEIWFVTGSQHLYGPETLKQVAAHSQSIAQGLDQSDGIPLKVVFKPIVTTPEEIRALCLEATSNPDCGGIIAWMHTFSPSKMWIGGLSVLTKPLLHLHTQFNRDLPWQEIDMDFMNLNQAAHGDRESSATGKIAKCKPASPVGCARPAAGTTGRAPVSPASATTCATSQSPTATKSAPK
jgi:L-arabinose isomerase